LFVFSSLPCDRATRSSQHFFCPRCGMTVFRNYLSLAIVSQPHIVCSVYMTSISKIALILIAVVSIAGCSSPPVAPNTEKGPNGTIAYFVEVETSEPGCRIEANNDYIGKSPCTLKIFGDKDGTFHNFGSHEYIVKAYPANTNHYLQTKIFQTGKWFTQEDMIPHRIFFDMSQKTSSFSVDPQR
jgi:hypothetical protein